MIERIRSIALSVGLFGAAFVLGLYFTFPMDLVSRAVEAQFERAVGYSYDLEIERTRFAGINGVHLQGVSLTSTESATPDTPVVPTRLDRLTVRTSLLGLLMGRVGGSVDLRAGDGRMWVGVTRGGDGALEVDLRSVEFPLERLLVIRDKFGMSVIGQVTGEALLQLDAEGTLTDGVIHFESPALSLSEGIPNIPALDRAGAFVRLPATDLGEVVVDVTAEESRLTLNDVGAMNGDVVLDAQGTVDLRSPFRASRVAVNLLLSLDSAYVEAADLGPILGRSSLLQRALTPEGYVLSFIGSAGNLSPTPGGATSFE